MTNSMDREITFGQMDVNTSDLGIQVIWGKENIVGQMGESTLEII